MWRPDNWENPFLKSSVAEWGETRKAYEAGADAILNAIRERGHIRGESLRNVKDALGWAGINPNSKWYPIPDEEP